MYPTRVFNMPRKQIAKFLCSCPFCVSNQFTFQNSPPTITTPNPTFVKRCIHKHHQQSQHFNQSHSSIHKVLQLLWHKVITSSGITREGQEGYVYWAPKIHCTYFPHLFCFHSNALVQWCTSTVLCVLGMARGWCQPWKTCWAGQWQINLWCNSRYRKINTVFLHRGHAFPQKLYTNKLPVPYKYTGVEKLKVPYKWRMLSWWHIPNQLWCAV